MRFRRRLAPHPLWCPARPAHIRSVVRAAGLLLCAAVPLRAQPAPPTPASTDSLIAVAGSVRGPNGLGIANAEVTITPKPVPGLLTLSRRIYTDDSGGFRMPAVPRGPVSVGVRRIGYKPISVETVLPQDTPLGLLIDQTPTTLSAVVVQDRRRNYEGPLADFNRRHDFGLGRFITRSQIDSRNAIRTTDLLRMLPGVSVSSSGMGSSSLRLRGARCDPLIWIDGSPALAGYFDVDAFQPSSLDGIEVYNGVSEVPVELRGPRGEERCGVIAIWSRMPERQPRKSKRKPVTAEELNQLIASATVYTADQVDRPAQMNPDFPLEPSYPDSLKSAHTPGSAVVEFVVDAEGRVETETISVVMASHAAFGRAARDAAFSVRFLPALFRGGPVRQIVQLPVQFQLSGRKD